MVPNIHEYLGDKNTDLLKDYRKHVFQHKFSSLMGIYEYNVYCPTWGSLDDLYNMFLLLARFDCAV